MIPDSLFLFSGENLAFFLPDLWHFSIAMFSLTVLDLCLVLLELVIGAVSRFFFFFFIYLFFFLFLFLRPPLSLYVFPCLFVSLPFFCFSNYKFKILKMVLNNKTDSFVFIRMDHKYFLNFRPQKCRHSNCNAMCLLL